MLELESFIKRWKDTGGSEHANYQLFVIELTELLGLERPNPATDDDSNDHYRFERPVTFAHIGGAEDSSIHQAKNSRYR